jgi:hypothetical protein
MDVKYHTANEVYIPLYISQQKRSCLLKFVALTPHFPIIPLILEVGDIFAA